MDDAESWPEVGKGAVSGTGSGSGSVAGSVAGGSEKGKDAEGGGATRKSTCPFILMALLV